MDYSYLLDKHQLDAASLLKLGFKNEGSLFTQAFPTSISLFYFELELDKEQISLKVFDNSTKEAYLPFELESLNTPLVLSLRDEGEKLIKDILDKCSTVDDTRERLLKYIKDTYNSEPDYPWPEDYPNFGVVRIVPQGKWYGLFMSVPYKKLGINKEGDAEVINLKADTEKIPSLIKDPNIIQAYHMSKKTWITVILNSKISFEKLAGLVDESYNLIKAKKK